MHNKKEYVQKDKIILDLFKTNPEYAFQLMFDTYYIPLCLYAIQITDSFCMSEDIVQDFFITFWERKYYNGIALNLRSYLFQAIRNNVYSNLKKNKFISLEDLTDSEINIEEIITDEEKLREEEKKLMEELNKLPQQELAVVKSIILENKKYKETAKELNISINTVKTHLSRALKRLRAKNRIILFLYF